MWRRCRSGSSSRMKIQSRPRWPPRSRRRGSVGLLDPELHQLGVRAGVRLLKVDVPVAQILERDRLAGHRATHIGAGFANPIFAVEILDLGLSSRLGGAFVAVHSKSSVEAPR